MSPPIITRSVARSNRPSLSMQSTLTVQSRNGEWKCALQTIDEMKQCSVIDSRRYGECVTVVAKGRQWQRAIDLLRTMRRDQCIPSAATYTSVLNACTRAWSHALRLLWEMESRTLFAYNAVLHACAYAGSWDCALQLLSQMKQDQIHPDVVAYSACISACGKSLQWQRSLELLDVMRNHSILPNIVSCNAALSACEKGSQWNVALDLLNKMECEDNAVKPDVISYNAVITACGNDGRWDTAIQIFERLCSRGLSPTLVSHNAVLSSLAQASRWQHALKIFDAMSDHDTISYHATMNACAAVGNWKTALDLMTRLKQQRGLTPNAVSYGTLITACVNGEQHLLARHIYRDACRCNVHDHWHDKANGIVDFHDYIAIVASVALQVILEDLVAARDIVLIVGQGHHSGQQQATLRPALLETMTKFDPPLLGQVEKNAGRIRISRSSIAQWMDRNRRRSSDH